MIASTSPILGPRPISVPIRALSRALSPVPGAPWTMLFARAVQFDQYYAIIRARYLDPLDRLVLQFLTGQLWDRAEPSGYMGKDDEQGNARPRCLFP